MQVNRFCAAERRAVQCSRETPSGLDDSSLEYTVHSVRGWLLVDRKYVLAYNRMIPVFGR